MNALEQAQAFLLDALAAGPVPAATIRARAEAAGLGWRNIEAAKAALGAVSERRDGAWFWTLSNTARPQDRNQDRNTARPQDRNTARPQDRNQDRNDAEPARVVPIRPGSPAALGEDRPPCARCARLEAQVADLQARLARAESRSLPSSWNAGQGGVRCDECRLWPAAESSEWGNPWCKIGRTSIRRAHDRRKCSHFEPMDDAERAKSRGW